MWKKIALSLTLFLLPAAVLAAEISGTVDGPRHWSGEVFLTDIVTVAPGAVVTLAPGTTVRPRTAGARLVVQGVLKARGTAEKPILFAAPAGWQGVEFVEAPEGSIFEHCRFEGGETAIASLATHFAVRSCSFRNCGTAIKLLRESHPAIEDSLFADNEIGIVAEMKSAPAIRRNRFTGHQTTAVIATHGSTGEIAQNQFERNKQGIGLLQKFTARIVDNRFVENETALFCNQTQNTPLVRGNLFEKNGNALVNFSFAYPAVENNRFVGNTTAIHNDQFGSPLVSRNLFRDNRTAVHNNRKSNPRIEKNVVEGSALALFCDYSSYPQVKGNNFLNNTMGVKLGIFQSADWEKRSGSRSIVQQNALQRKSQNPLLAQAPTEFQDRVDVSGNWWGMQTDLLARAGANGNLAIFHDRLDQPEVSYEGFGPEKYRLDRVVFHPWLNQPVADAGPETKK